MADGFAKEGVDYGAFNPDEEAESGKKRPVKRVTEEYSNERMAEAIEKRMARWLEADGLPDTESKKSFAELMDLATLIENYKVTPGKKPEEELAGILSVYEPHMVAVQKVSDKALNDIQTYIAMKIKENDQLGPYRDLIGNKRAQ